MTQDPRTQGPTGDVNEFSTTAGSDATAGTWEVVIPEISYTPRGATESVSQEGSLDDQGGCPVSANLCRAADGRWDRESEKGERDTDP